MRGSKSVKELAFVFLLAFFFGIGTFLYPQTELEITVPGRDGIQVGMQMTVEGTASISSGNYLWVLVHRIKGFKKVWWPQSEGEIDPGTRNWSVDVTFGGPQDIGNDFEIAVIVVNQQEHLKLETYLTNAMSTGDFRPIIMPPTMAAPVYRTVKKVSHN